MKFDLWTFSIQIINFAVLLLILNRILYRPVREIMEKRRAQAAKTLEEADRARAEAEELQAQNQLELKKFQEQRGQLLEEMKNEVSEQRKKLLADVDQETQRHIDKERSLFEAERVRQTAAIKQMAMDTVLLFAANICRDIADEDFHHALCRRAIEKIEQITVELGSHAEGEELLRVEVVSAYPLSAGNKHALQDALETNSGCRVALDISQDHELLAGLKIKTGEKSYDASLLGQLNTFKSKMKEKTDV